MILVTALMSMISLKPFGYIIYVVVILNLLTVLYSLLESYNLSKATQKMPAPSRVSMPDSIFRGAL
jgi:hypothetical protein